MSSKMLINAVEPEEYRVAILKDGDLDEFYIETSAKEEIKGNIYKAIVSRIEPSLQAAFINYGAEKNGFLTMGEIHPEYYEPEGIVSDPKAPVPIANALKQGKEILVQVTKEQIRIRACGQLATQIIACRPRLCTSALRAHA